jgi:AcrR family transcriptional regulator
VLAGGPTLREKERLDREIRESAQNLFLDRGFEGISLDGIASAAVTTKASVYASVASKEALFSSVLWWGS